MYNIILIKGNKNEFRFAMASENKDVNCFSFQVHKPLAGTTMKWETKTRAKAAEFLAESLCSLLLGQAGKGKMEGERERKEKHGESGWGGREGENYGAEYFWKCEWKVVYVLAVKEKEKAGAKRKWETGLRKSFISEAAQVEVSYGGVLSQGCDHVHRQAFV